MARQNPNLRLAQVDEGFSEDDDGTLEQNQQQNQHQHEPQQHQIIQQIVQILNQQQHQQQQQQRRKNDNCDIYFPRSYVFGGSLALFLLLVMGVLGIFLGFLRCPVGETVCLGFMIILAMIMFGELTKWGRKQIRKFNTVPVYRCTVGFQLFLFIALFLSITYGAKNISLVLKSDEKTLCPYYVENQSPLSSTSSSSTQGQSAQGYDKSCPNINTHSLTFVHSNILRCLAKVDLKLSCKVNGNNTLLPCRPLTAEMRTGNLNSNFNSNTNSNSNFTTQTKFLTEQNKLS